MKKQQMSEESHEKERLKVVAQMQQKLTSNSKSTNQQKSITPK